MNTVLHANNKSVRYYCAGTPAPIIQQHEYIPTYQWEGPVNIGREVATIMHDYP